MKACKCGSMAINNTMHGRDGTRDDLCDVCFWRERAKELEEQWSELRTILDKWRKSEKYQHHVLRAIDAVIGCIHDTKKGTSNE